MHFERDRRTETGVAAEDADRGIVDAFVIDERDAWLVVARGGEPIERWLLEGVEDGRTKLTICRAVYADGSVLLDQADPNRDRLLSEIEETS